MYKWIGTYQNLMARLEIAKYNKSACIRERKRWLSYDTIGDLGKNSDAVTIFANVQRLDEDIKYYNIEIDAMELEMEELEQVVAKFKGVDNEIAYLRYIKGYNLTTIAYELGYTYQYIKNRSAEIKKQLSFLKVTKK